MIPAIQALVLAVAFDHRFWGGQEGLLSFSISELIAYPVLLLIVLDHARRLRYGSQDSLPTLSRVPKVFLVYFAWIGVAALTTWLVFSSSDGLHSLKDCMPGIVLYLAVLTWVKTRTDLTRVVLAILVAIGLLSLLGYAQFLFGGPLINPIAENAYDKFAIGGESRVSHPVVGGFGTPNAFAVFVAPFMVVCTYWLLEASRGHGRKSRLFALSIVAAVAVALLLTQAKAVLAVSAFTLAALVFAERRRRTGREPSVAALLFGGLCVSAAGIALLLMLEPMLPPGLGLGTMRGRLFLAVEAVDVLRDRASIAIFGGGVDLFTAVVPSTFHVHTEYLLQALMWGIPGAVLFVAVFLDGLLRERSTWWAPRYALLCAGLILLFESAGGSQRQAMVFLILGLTHASSRVRGAPIRSKGAVVRR